MRIVLSLAIVASLGASAGCGHDLEGPRRVLPRDYFGVNAQNLMHTATVFPGDEVVGAGLASVERTGIRFVRGNVIWPEIEPLPPAGGKHAYSFAGLDSWVAALARHGLRWQALVVGVPTPSWAAATTAAVCGFSAPPARSADLAALAGAIARRVRPQWQSLA